MENIKLIFLPKASDENPYQNQLIDNLQKLKITIERPENYSFFLSDISQSKPNIVHFHWLDPFFLIRSNNKFKSLLKILTFIGQLSILKIMGVKIVWTVHNLKNHENSNLFLDRIYRIVMAKFSNAIITHCKAAKEEVIKLFFVKRKDKIFVVPHGNYIDCYENRIDNQNARKVLDLKKSELVFLFLGLIRPYKGVFELIDIFQQIDSDQVKLIIAGKIYKDSPEITELLAQKIADDQRIKLIPDFVPPDKIQLYMNASDVVVFPYRDILTSGAVLLAMSFGKACIAPNKGCIGEVLDDAGAFLYDIDDENGLMKAMKFALEKHSDLLVMGQHNQQLAEKYNWRHIAEMTNDVYRSCL
jgi:beta-1,4-mannosyltransferase